MPRSEPIAPQSPRPCLEIRHGLLLTAAFLLIGFTAYVPALTAGFHSDDYLHIGAIIQGNMPFAPAGDGRGFLRPVVGASLWVDHVLWGTRPVGFHATNILLHVLNSLLVAGLFRTLIPPGKSDTSVAAMAAGLLFLLMGCHVEPVSWISGRTDLLATFFALLTLLCAAWGMQRDSGKWLLGSTLPFALALFSKESALALPPLLGAMAVYLWAADRWRVCPRRAMATVLLWMALFAAYLFIRHQWLGAFVAGYGVRGHLRFHQDLLAQATARYIWRVFLPPMPRGTEALLLPNGRLLADIFTVALLGITVLWAWMASKKPGWRTSFFLYVAFWAALMPSINLRIQWTNAEGERFLYLASVFVALGIVWALSHVTRRSARLASLGVILLLQATILWHGVHHWHVAGQTARAIVSGIQAVSEDQPVLLLNKPDSYDGALLFRTGLVEAVHRFGPNPAPETTVEALFASTLFQEDHEFAVDNITVGDSPLLRLRALDPTSVFVEEDVRDRIEVLENNGRTARFRFRVTPPEAIVLYHDSGGMYRYDVNTGTAERISQR